ncbi:hypothetical protein PAXRUDRAFT_17287 [Paxillus rubicundulus Ve08.2h10]|uniref:Uncharacterized protein n=1 Tax=Paxillus rubicundulus Ve08.2h10 TaxID=930991 RepID=A0A0D0C3K2_9AGAM|nr:hypothetical protein PAXRUDRAFT_17287 [Paxillus rubicundulus Ve08.2h10]
MSQDRVLGLRNFELDDRELVLLEQLHNVHNVLKTLKDTTLYFSHSTPNLATVIPAMDLIDEKLTTYSLDHKYSPTIHATNVNWEESWIDAPRDLVGDTSECSYTREETDDHNSLGKDTPKLKKDNFFNTMVALTPPKPSELGDELLEALPLH